VYTYITFVGDAFRPGTFVDAFRFIGDHPGFLFDKTVEHLELSLVALGIAIALALPLGLWLGHLRRGLTLALGASTLGRAMPSLVLIAFGVTVLGIGFWNTTAALVVLAVPSILTNAYFGIAGVDRDVVDAARGMGLSERQILLRVELPLGLPLVMAGIRLALVQVWATATIAAMVAGPGLGRVITDGFFRSDYAKGIAGAVVVAVVALVLELLTAGLQRGVDTTRRGTASRADARTEQPIGT